MPARPSWPSDNASARRLPGWNEVVTVWPCQDGAENNWRSLTGRRKEIQPVIARCPHRPNLPAGARGFPS